MGYFRYFLAFALCLAPVGARATGTGEYAEGAAIFEEAAVSHPPLE